MRTILLLLTAIALIGIGSAAIGPELLESITEKIGVLASSLGYETRNIAVLPVEDGWISIQLEARKL
jgi:hypothetical protein